MNTSTLLVVGLAFAAAAVVASPAIQKEGMSCCGGMMTMQPSSQTGTQTAKVAMGVQKATVIIDGGYSPSAITLKKGQPVKLTFTRKEKSGCGGTVEIKSLNMSKDVASGKSVTFKFTPKQAGDISFTCGMGMLQGKLIVK